MTLLSVAATLRENLLVTEVTEPAEDSDRGSTVPKLVDEELEYAESGVKMSAKDSPIPYVRAQR